LAITLGYGHCFGGQRMRVVKLVLAWGTTQACSGGQPKSVAGFRQTVAIAGVIWAGETTPLSGSA
jgi:hypothetical protein